MAKQKVAVSERALYQRIDRKLRLDDEKLCTARNANVETSVGRYYIINVQRNIITTQRVDLEALGRELAVIKPWEEVV